jgi:hypothetical protein
MNSMDSGKDHQLKMQLIHSYIEYLKYGMANFMLVKSSVIYQRLLTVHHEILIMKFHYYRCQEENINWFKSYSSNREEGEIKH